MFVLFWHKQTFSASLLLRLSEHFVNKGYKPLKTASAQPTDKDQTTVKLHLQEGETYTPQQFAEWEQADVPHCSAALLTSTVPIRVLNTCPSRKSAFSIPTATALMQGTCNHMENPADAPSLLNQ